MDERTLEEGIATAFRENRLAMARRYLFIYFSPSLPPVFYFNVLTTGYKFHPEKEHHPLRLSTTEDGSLLVLRDNRVRIR